jgi:hypothetical protein
MQKPLSDAQLRERLKPCASTYLERQNELNTRERQVEKTLDMMIEVMTPIVDYLTSLKVPATVRRDKTGIVVDLGAAPNMSGQLAIKVAPDFRLVVSKRSVTGAGDIGTHDQSPREPADFGAPHWRGELAESLTWILGGSNVDRPYAQGAHGDDDEDDD